MPIGEFSTSPSEQPQDSQPQELPPADTFEEAEASPADLQGQTEQSVTTSTSLEEVMERGDDPEEEGAPEPLSAQVVETGRAKMTVACADDPREAHVALPLSFESDETTDGQVAERPTSQFAVTETPRGPGEGLRRGETLKESVEKLGRNVRDNIVIVGSTAMHEAVPGTRKPKDLDAVGSNELVSWLSEQEGWERRKLEDGREFVANGEYEIGTHWTTMDRAYDALSDRNWENKDGIRIARLSDVTVWKDEAGREKDQQDLQELRDKLKDPNAPPFDWRVTQREADIVRSCLPPHMQDDESLEAGIRLAADGMLAVQAMYGPPETDRVLPIVGSFDTAPAFYHNGKDLVIDLRYTRRHMDNINAADRAAGREPTFTPNDYVLGFGAQTNADRNYGDGRQKDQPPDNPNGYDEYRSGKIVEAHAAYLGVGSEGRLFNVVHGTTFREGTGEQLGKDSEDPLVRAIAGVDLHKALASYYGIIETFHLIPEDIMSNRWNHLRVLGQVADEEGAEFHTVAEAFDFMDEYANARPAGIPNAPTIMEAGLARGEASARFTHPDTGFQFPYDWSLASRAMRLELVDTTREFMEKIRSGTWTWRHAYTEAALWALKRQDEEAENRGLILP